MAPTIESPFYLEHPSIVDLWSNKYYDCYLATYGGVFYLDYTQSTSATFKDQGSSYEYNAAFYGAAIHTAVGSPSSISITILDCTFTNNYA